MCQRTLTSNDSNTEVACFTANACALMRSACFYGGRPLDRTDVRHVVTHATPMVWDWIYIRISSTLTSAPHGRPDVGRLLAPRGSGCSSVLQPACRDPEPVVHRFSKRARYCQGYVCKVLLYNLQPASESWHVHNLLLATDHAVPLVKKKVVIGSCSSPGAAVLVVLLACSPPSAAVVMAHPTSAASDNQSISAASWHCQVAPVKVCKGPRGGY